MANPANKKPRFELETQPLSKDIGVQTLRDNFDFTITGCCNISANGDKINKDAVKRTLMFILTDPKDPSPPESRLIFKACEYEFIRHRISDQLDKMVGGTLTIFKGTMYMKNCFLLSTQNCAIRAPEGVVVNSLEEKPNVRVHRPVDDRSNLDEFGALEELTNQAASRSAP